MLEVVAHEKNICGNLIQTIEGRDIHAALELGRDYSNWVKAQIESLQLIENVDYIIFAQKGENPQGGRPRTEYYFTIDIAKHIALASRTEKGRVYRQALIDLENRVFEPTAPKLPSAEDRALSVFRIYERADQLGLADGYTRILAQELTQNLMKEAQAPQGQLLLTEKSATDNYFQIEDLREDLLKYLTDRQWFEWRGTFGKIVKREIQSVDPSIEPIKVNKSVNGEMRPVNAWPMEYYNIALEAVTEYIEKLELVVK